MKDSHIRFCERFLTHGNGSLAYNEALQPASTKNLDVMAAQLMKREDVRNKIQELQAQARQQFKISCQYLIDKHLLVVKTYEKVLDLLNRDILTLDEQLLLDKLKIVRAADYNRALQEISRLEGLYKDKSEVDVNNNVRHIVVRVPTNNDVEDIEI